MTTLDNSFPLAVRAARTGDARMLPRLAKMVDADCPGTSELHRGRRLWFEGSLAARHGSHRVSRRCCIDAAEKFVVAGRPLLRAAALATAGATQDSEAVLRFCGATAYPIIRWSAALTRHGSTELTSRELEVATLAAKGCSNRTIAQTLTLSERTIHRHLESVFRKLDLHSRWQLTLALLKPEDGG
jgi:DNA-binding CsgD family transcriptional regulator